MNYLLIVFLSIGIFGCAKEDQVIADKKQSWSLEEPQIINNKGKIFLTSIQHQSEQALMLTDALVFETTNNTKELMFTTLTRCYDDEQKEFIEKKKFKFTKKISIQKLMPKESFHPKYLIKGENLNCTFKFNVKKIDGSSHQFRLYSQKVEINAINDKDLISIIHNSKDKIPVLDYKNMHKENFLLPDPNVTDLELVCQSFRLKYLSHQELLNPFYGFNVKSVTKPTYPRELCRIISKKGSNYILSKPFQIEFIKIQNPIKIDVPSKKYKISSKSHPVMYVYIKNKSKFPVNYHVQFPDKITIKKIKAVYTKPLHIQYSDKKRIKKISAKRFKVNLNAHESTVFTIYTDLSRICYSIMTTVHGAVGLLDPVADTSLPPHTIKVVSEKHQKFYYKKTFTNSNYISTKIVRADRYNKWHKGKANTNKINYEYAPTKNKDCIKNPPLTIIRSPAVNIPL